MNLISFVCSLPILLWPPAAFLLAILAFEFVLNLELRNQSPVSIQSRFQGQLLRKPKNVRTKFFCSRQRTVYAMEAKS